METKFRVQSKQSAIKTIVVAAILFSYQLFSQGPVPWFTNGNNVSAGNFFGSTNNAPVPFQTNSFTRMIIDGGNQTQTGGRIAIGNNLPNNFAPQSRVHIHQTGGGGLNNTFIRFTTNVTNNTASDGFAIGNSTQGFTGNTGEVHLLQYEQEPIIMSAPNSNTTNLLPYEWFRLENGKTIQLTPSSPLRSTDGCIGLNKSNPRAHIDMVTPAIQGGEEFLFAKPDDVSGQHV